MNSSKASATSWAGELTGWAGMAAITGTAEIASSLRDHPLVSGALISGALISGAFAPGFRVVVLVFIYVSLSVGVAGALMKRAGGSADARDQIACGHAR